MKTIFAIVLTALLSGSLRAADSLANTRLWLDRGIGLARPAEDYDLAFNIDLALRSNGFIYSMGWYHVSHVSLFDSYKSSASSLHIMAGISLSNGFVMLNAESGVAWVSINNEHSYARQEVHFTGVGVPFKVTFYVAPLPWLSIGIGYFYCLNARENFYSPMLCEGPGRMR